MNLIPIPPDISVLNCGAGDMTFSFDKNDPLECARAERVVKDMLRRGYMLFAKVDDKYVRVKEFDDQRHEYIIADGPEASVTQEARYTGPPLKAEEVPTVEPEVKDKTVKEPHPNSAEAQADKTLKKLGRGRKGRRVPARGTPITGVAPTAGG